MHSTLQSTGIYRIIALLLCAISLTAPALLSAQEKSPDETAADTARLEEEASDTLSRKEIKRLEQQLKWEQAGPFFDHSDRPGRRAALYSFGFPGLGQIYNRKYWKLPIVYGVIGTGVYFGASNGKELKRFNKALEIRLSGGTDEFSGILSDAQLTSNRNYYRRNTELSAMLSGLFYGLNIIDAVVDAHLFDFDISDDLSFHWYPNLLTGNNRVFPGIQLSLSFN